MARTELTLRSADGATRTAVLEVADPAERRKLTEPENLLHGLGFNFWTAAVARQGRHASKRMARAARAGLAVGDVVLSVNGTAVPDFHGAEPAHRGGSRRRAGADVIRRAGGAALAARRPLP